VLLTSEMQPGEILTGPSPRWGSSVRFGSTREPFPSSRHAQFKLQIELEATKNSGAQSQTVLLVNANPDNDY